jgi:LmbE family N-acetylglucosaminyl deacetylase
MNPVTAVAPPAGWLPRAHSVLVVLARPGQESADLGGLLYAFRRAGTGLALLCLTRGEASPLNSTRAARLEAVRPWELQLAAGILGISQVTVASYPDGGLGWRPEAELSAKIGRAVRQYSADLLLIIDPATGDRDEAADDIAVAAAACAAARRAGLPVLAHTADTVPAWARRIPQTQEETCPATHPQPTRGSRTKPLAVVTSRPWPRADTSC